MKQLLLLVLSAQLLVSCSPSPRDIVYGTDMCHFCKMTIVDHQHAAEAVTSKGKVYMFDAIECMVHFLAENKNQSFAFNLVNDYTQPGVLMPAEECTFLISKAIPSPMGAFLSAFHDKTIAEQMQAQKGGMLLDWETLQQRMADTPVMADAVPE